MPIRPAMTRRVFFWAPLSVGENIIKAHAGPVTNLQKTHDKLTFPTKSYASMIVSDKIVQDREGSLLVRWVLVMGS